jgi:hypothetical protein
MFVQVCCLFRATSEVTQTTAMEPLNKMFSTIMGLENTNATDRFLSVWSKLLSAAQVAIFLSGIAQGTVKSWAPLLELVSLGLWACYCVKKKQAPVIGQVVWMLVVGATHKVAQTHGISVEILVSLLTRRREIPGKKRFFSFGRKKKLPQVSLSAFLQGHIWWNMAFQSIILTTIITFAATKLSSGSFPRLQDGTEPLSRIQEVEEEGNKEEMQREEEPVSQTTIAPPSEEDDMVVAESQLLQQQEGYPEEYPEEYPAEEDPEEEYSEEEELVEDTGACYLVYEADSSGRLFEIYSMTPIENAIGMWIPGPGHALPDFKFTQGQNGNGKNVLIGNCAAGTLGRKNYASGWCSFIRSAQLKNGIVTLVDPMEGHKGLLVDVYIYNDCAEKEETVLLQAFHPTPVGNALAAACMPRNSRFLYLGISGIPLNKWLEDGRKHGTSSKLQGHDNSTVSLIAESPALTKRRQFETPGTSNKPYSPAFKENYLHTPARAFDDPTPVKPTPLGEIFEGHARSSQTRRPLQESNAAVIEGQ